MILSAAASPLGCPGVDVGDECTVHHETDIVAVAERDCGHSGKVAHTELTTLAGGAELCERDETISIFDNILLEDIADVEVRGRMWLDNNSSLAHPRVSLHGGIVDFRPGTTEVEATIFEDGGGLYFDSVGLPQRGRARVIVQSESPARITVASSFLGLELVADDTVSIDLSVTIADVSDVDWLAQFGPHIVSFVGFLEGQAVSPELEQFLQSLRRDRVESITLCRGDGFEEPCIEWPLP